MTRIDERSQQSAVRWNEVHDGMIHLVLDDPQAKVNTLNDVYAQAMDIALDRIEANASSLIGVVLRSAKSSFFAGGDLNRLLAVEPADREGFVADVDVRKHRLQRLENSGVPVVAILDGAALGGGLELALACHRRIAIRSARTLLGFPETALGLMPGAGGVVRSALMIGAPALELITTARRLDADEALAVGLIDDVVDSAQEAIERAEAWLATAARPARQRWQTAPARLERPVPVVPIARAAPGRQLVERVAALAAGGDVAAAMHAESVALGDLVVTSAAKNTIRVNFHDVADFRRAVRARAADADATKPTLVGRTEEAHQLLSGAPAWNYIDGRDGTDVIVDAHTVEVTDEAILGAGQGRLHRDLVGDGLSFLEVALPPDHPTTSPLGGTLAGLLRHGLAVVEVRPGPAPSAVLEECAMRSADNYPAALLSEALVWSGMRCLGLPDTSDVEVSDAGIAAAHEILRAIANRALELSTDHPGLEQALDLVTVRFGLLPPWTGGAHRYLMTIDKDVNE